MDNGREQLGIIRNEVESQLQRYLRLDRVVESFLCAEIERAMNDRSDVTLPIATGELKEYCMVFNAMQRGSLFLSIFSFMEFQLVRVCREVFEEYSETRLMSFKGNSITKSKLFIGEVVRIDLPQFLSDGGEIDILNLLRNVLIHHYGAFSKVREQKFNRLGASITPFPDVLVMPGTRQLGMGEKFIPEVLERTSKMFGELFNRMEKVVPGAAV